MSFLKPRFACITFVERNDDNCLRLCIKKPVLSWKFLNSILGTIFFFSWYSSNKIRKTQNEHRLSKFELSVVVNLMQISLFFGVYTTCFLI